MKSWAVVFSKWCPHVSVIVSTNVPSMCETQVFGLMGRSWLYGTQMCVWRVICCWCRFNSSDLSNRPHDHLQFCDFLELKTVYNKRETLVPVVNTHAQTMIWVFQRAYHYYNKGENINNQCFHDTVMPFAITSYKLIFVTLLLH